MKHIRKRVWGTLLCLAMLLSLLPTVALAEEGTSVEYLDPTTGTTQICPSATVVTAGSTAWSSAGGTEEAWYVVNSDVEIASRITVTGNVHLILVDGYTLTAPNGISVTSGNSLTIYGQSADTGALIAGTDGVADDQDSDKAYQAGIGGNRGNTDVYAHGNITINGGSITAYGGFGAAGIGGGFGTTSGVEENGTISINGGTVKAIGGAQAAGIGSGTQNGVAGGDITITGGNVTAQGGEKAAGIGGGQMARDTVGRSITISGGTVNATGGDKAAGIGSGYNAMVNKSINNIKINGSADVTAQGGEGAAGIGSSYEGKTTGAIQIGGSAKVIANGGNSNKDGNVNTAGAGIGSGGGFTSSSAVGKITISGGTVEATGGTGEEISSSGSSYSFSGAGIGSGGSFFNSSSTNDIVISTGTITAKAGGEGAAGIGSGAGNSKSGNFSTGTSGKAVIYTDSITDTNTDDWSGIVFQGDDGKGQVYGTVTLREDLTLESGQTLTVPENTKLIVPKEKKLIIENGAMLIVEGKGTLTNNGTVSSEGTLVNSGTVGGSGVFTGNDLPNIFVAEFGGDKFKTLPAAINAANRATGGGTVTLLKDATLSTKMDADVALVIENGKTLTVNDTQYLASGTLEIKAGGGLKLGTDQLVGTSGAINLISGTATLNLNNANAATNPSVSLTLNGEASVDGSIKALLPGADGGTVPIAISVAGTSEAVVSENGVLNLVNGSSLTVADSATFTVDGILEVHSTAKFDGKATVSGKVYVFETNEEANPISGASITLTSTGAVYAEKTKLDGTTITPAHMTESTEKYISTSSNVGEKTFANQWTLSYKITLDPNDGTLVGTTSELWTDANGKLTAMPSAPTRIGYTFQGWYNGDTKFDFNTPVTDNITLTAQWTINTYTVKFNSNGGSGSMAAQTFSYGTAQNLTANAFTRPGYTFAGWNTKVDGSGTPYGDKAELTLTDNLTLYAQWELIIPPFIGHSIAVITDGNGTVSVNPTAADAGETVTITVTPKDGYKVGTITVTSVTGQSIAVSGNTFTMPAASVTVKVTFVKADRVNPFTDVTEANWYYDEVYYVWANGLMQGTSATTFGPNVDTTRAMVVTILWRLEGEPASGYDMDYSDVAGGAWYAGAVRWATEHGIVNGSEGQFYPGGTVTREQLAAMLYRYAQYKGYDLTAGGDLSGFADAGAVSGWAETSLAWAVGQRLIQGSANQIDPTGSAIRAQVAAILMRFCENVAEV